MPRHRVHATKFPFFPFYVDDWLTSDAIADFTLEQQGAYLRLLLRQWKAADGRLPGDEALLAKYSQLGERWGEVGRPILKRCFKRLGGSYFNRRLHTEWLHVRNRSEQAKAAAAKRWHRNGDGDE